MWVRIIGKIGNSKSVVLPAQLLRGLNWKRGDYMHISVVGPDKVMLMKFEAKDMPDRVTEFLQDLPVKNYD
ncbi:MAG: AbrB/MazE/SpoVT family DNA-binding domain-containing protein [Candidatus Azambacteria bacterium]|nr:AbrB/MazE/SpoVT family DNA-binding domain-containing protein [Candidatus Azambacteria bacterium]